MAAQTGAVDDDWAQQVKPTKVLPNIRVRQMVRSNWMNGTGRVALSLRRDEMIGAAGQTPCRRIWCRSESRSSGVMQYPRFHGIGGNSRCRRWSGQANSFCISMQSKLALEIYVKWPEAPPPPVGIHTAVYDHFRYDILPFYQTSGRGVLVRVYRPVDRGGEPRGKQTLYPARGELCSFRPWPLAAGVVGLTGDAQHQCIHLVPDMIKIACRERQHYHAQPMDKGEGCAFAGFYGGNLVASTNGISRQ